MTRTETTRRWDHDGERVAAVRAWLTGRGPQPGGLGTVDGRVDLRGLPLTGAPLTVGQADDPDGGVEWASLDLSDAHLDALRLFGVRIDDCRFDGASLADLRVRGTTVTGCSFRRADLRQSMLGSGPWHGRATVWSDTTFDRARLHRTVFTGAELRGCRFDTPGRLLQLQDCEIQACTFAGVLDSLIIDGRGHRSPVGADRFSADFSRAVFRNAHVTGYRLDRTALPDQRDLLVVRRYAGTLTDAAVRLERDGTTPADRQAAMLLRRMAAAPGPDDDADTCFDVGGLGDDLAGAVIRALAPGAAAGDVVS